MQLYKNVVLFLFSAIFISNNISIANIVAHYNLDDDLSSTTTVINDISSDWGNATASFNDSSDLSWGVDGILNDAFTFSGNVPYYPGIDTNNQISATGDFTLSGWSKVSADHANRCVMFGQYSNLAASIGNMYLMASDTLKGGKARFRIFGNSAGDVDIMSDAALDDGQWHYIVVTRDSNKFTLYIDGNSEASITLSNISITQLSGLCVGNTNPLLTQRIPTGGTYDEIRIYDHALPASEIFAEYEFKKAGLLAYYTCDDDLSSTTTVINSIAASSWGDGIASFSGATDLVSGEEGVLNDAFAFSGNTSPYPGIDTTGQISATGDFTLAGWSKVSADPANRCVMFGQYSNLAASIGNMYLMASDKLKGGKARFRILGNSAGDVDIMSDAALDDGQWHHLAVTRDSNKFTLYIDGNSEASIALSNISVTQLSGLCFGNTNPLLTQRIPTGGTYDEIRIYDHALSAIDVVMEYKKGLLQQDLVAHYSCEDTLNQTGDRVANLVTSENSWGDATASFTRVTDLVSGTEGVVNDAFTFTSGAPNFPGIDTDGKISATDDFTLSGWAKTSVDPANRCIMFGQYGSYAGAMYMIACDKLYGYVTRFGIFGNSAGDLVLVSDDTMNDDKWHHLAVTRNGDTFTLYVDGVAEDSRTLANISIAQLSDLCIGNLNPSLAQRIRTDGSYDEIRIYTHALTAEDVKAVYQQDIGLFAYNPSPYDGQTEGIDLPLWTLSWNKPTIYDIALKCNVYIDDDADLSDAELLLSNSTATSVSVSLEADTTYYWYVDYYDSAMTVTLTGNVWTFDTKPLHSTNLYPADDAKGLPLYLKLTWDRGFGNPTHTVYISDVESDVYNRNFEPYRPSETYQYVNLEADKTYYWAVDEWIGGVRTHGSMHTFHTYRDLHSDTWVATDAVGRELPGYGECGAERSDKKVGVFYFLWLNNPSWDVFNVTEILAADPFNPPWTTYQYHYWAEPELGYYLNTDPYVLRKHASMLSDAGVDMVYFDVSNGALYTNEYMTLCEVWQQMRNEGQATPQICFLLNTNHVPTLQRLYDDFYSQNLYSDLWFYWKGKPLILSPLTDLSQEILDFFTIRYAWAWQGGEHVWSWLDHCPQKYGWDTDPQVPEQTSVCIAEHPISNIGRSFQAGETWGSGSQPAFDEYKLTGTEDLGIYFNSQWEAALNIDPEILFVTGWNEWIAVRQEVTSSTFHKNFIGEPLHIGDYFFIDQFNQEYSRDAEPMKGGHTDNYYYQMIDGIRKYKGVSAPHASDDPFDIDIDGNFADWNNVSMAYYDTYNDTIHRDYPGWSGYHYTNATGRNDIVEGKVAFDAYQIYFYVETADDLTSHTDSNWMMLFINADQNPATGWEGYDYMINRYRSDSVVTLERCLGDWNWEFVENLPYSYAGNQLEISVPRCLIEQDNAKDIAFDFHWADNIQTEGDIIEFAISGDSAPNRRFNYRYGKETPASYFEEDENFEGWEMTRNLINGVVFDGVLKFDINGSDSYMINSIPLNVDSDVYDYIHIRLKSNSPSTAAEFYWTTSSSTSWSQTKQIKFSIDANETRFKDYYVYVGGHYLWADTIRQLRFDPAYTATTGHIEIEFIRLQDRLPECGDFGYRVADLNQDCSVDSLDLSIIGNEWHDSSSGYKVSDMSRDGSVDELDLQMIAEQWLEEGI